LFAHLGLPNTRDINLLEQSSCSFRFDLSFDSNEVKNIATSSHFQQSFSKQPV